MNRITAFGGSAGAVTVAQLLHALPDSEPMPTSPPPPPAFTITVAVTCAIAANPTRGSNCTEVLKADCPLQTFKTYDSCLKGAKEHGVLPPLCRPSVQREYCHHRVAATAAAAAAAASSIIFVGGNVTCGIALSGGILPYSIKYRQVTASPVSPAYLDLHGTNDTTVPYDWEKANGDDSTWGDAVGTSAWLTSQRALNYFASIPGAGHVPFEAIFEAIPRAPCSSPAEFGCWNDFSFWVFVQRAEPCGSAVWCCFYSKIVVVVVVALLLRSNSNNLTKITLKAVLRSM